MVHLHNGILHSREKEGAPTLCDNMDGTGEHCAKWNKPVDEGQIPNTKYQVQTPSLTILHCGKVMYLFVIVPSFIK